MTKFLSGAAVNCTQLRGTRDRPGQADAPHVCVGGHQLQS